MLQFSKIRSIGQDKPDSSYTLATRELLGLHCGRTQEQQHSGQDSIEPIPH